MNLVVLALQLPNDLIGFLSIIVHQLVSDLQLLGEVLVLDLDVFDDVDDLPQLIVQLLVLFVPLPHLLDVPFAVGFIFIELNELLLSLLIESFLQVF